MMTMSKPNTELMYDALKKAGQDVKLYLHQEIISINCRILEALVLQLTKQDFMTYSIPGSLITFYDVENDVSKLPAV